MERTERPAVSAGVLIFPSAPTGQSVPATSAADIFTPAGVLSTKIVADAPTPAVKSKAPVASGASLQAIIRDSCSSLGDSNRVERFITRGKNGRLANENGDEL